jgi:hypothetical protein
VKNMKLPFDKGTMAPSAGIIVHRMHFFPQRNSITFATRGEAGGNRISGLGQFCRFRVFAMGVAEGEGSGC